MIRGLYTAGTGMITQRKRLDVTVNNMANVETTGFKQDKLLVKSFAEILISRSDDAGYENVGSVNNGVHVDEVFTDFVQGALEQTDRLTDFAIQGEGFFAVNTPEGVRYTRDGSFQTDENMQLVTGSGYPVLGMNGEPIYLTSVEFYVDLIQLTNFTNPEYVRKVGDNLYEGLEGAEPVMAGGKIRRGFLEGSNVDLVRQMTDMMEITRAFETNQKIASIIDESLGLAVKDIGRV